MAPFSSLLVHTEGLAREVEGGRTARTKKARRSMGHRSSNVWRLRATGLCAPRTGAACRARPPSIVGECRPNISSGVTWQRCRDRKSMTTSAEDKAERDRKNDEELAAAKAEESRRHEAREAEINASWSKKILVQGSGPAAYRGAQARVHVVGRAAVDKHVQGRAKAANFVSGSVFEDSRDRGCPLMLLLGRGTLVPALDRALLGMRVGERAEIDVKPEGGYGLAGSIAHPVMPGSATLTYDVELLAVAKEDDLWDLSFEEKMGLASERKARGNTLVAGGHVLMADAEYEQALRYLVFMPHAEEHETPLIAEALAATHLNLAATKLRMADERGAIKHAADALENANAISDGPKASKAHYRLAQAHTQLGEYARAREHFTGAEAAAGTDAAALGGIRKERERLERRQQKHVRDRKKAAERMVSGGGGGGDDDVGDGGDGAAAAATVVSGRLRDWSRHALSSPTGQTVAFTLIASLLVVLLAMLAQGVLLAVSASGVARAASLPESPSRAPK